ncbi:MAG: hypothetical protein KDC92_12660 [Bacteroidetes bacterium]|nr:hypothetical protein [Bacteroidota bacterium]
MKRIGLLLGVVIMLCSTQILQAKVRKDIPDWTLGAGIAYGSNLPAWGYHFKLHHVFSNLISAGPEFTYFRPVIFHSDPILSDYMLVYTSRLDIIASTRIPFKVYGGFFSIYPVVGISFFNQHFEFVPKSSGSDNPFNSKGVVLGANFQIPVIKWGKHGSHIAMIGEYRYSTSKLSNHTLTCGLNYFFFLKEMP